MAPTKIRSWRDCGQDFTERAPCLSPLASEHGIPAHCEKAKMLALRSYWLRDRLLDFSFVGKRRLLTRYRCSRRGEQCLKIAFSLMIAVLVILYATFRKPLDESVCRSSEMQHQLWLGQHHAAIATSNRQSLIMSLQFLAAATTPTVVTAGVISDVEGSHGATPLFSSRACLHHDAPKMMAAFMPQRCEAEKNKRWNIMPQSYQ